MALTAAKIKLEAISPSLKANLKLFNNGIYGAKYLMTSKIASGAPIQASKKTDSASHGFHGTSIGRNFLITVS